MNALGDAVTEQIRLAMQSTNPDDIVTGVKSAVADEVRALSPDADVVLTDYFNHSYVPDIVVAWGDGRGREERPIFLRNRLSPAQTSQDVAALASSEPVVLALARPEPDRRFENLRVQARQTNRVLVTDVGSLAELAAPAGSPRQDQGHRGTDAPLLRLIQANLLKGGRGLLTVQDAERLRSRATPTADNQLSEKFLSSFEQSADEIFAPDAALRLRRAAELLRFSLAHEGSDQPPSLSGELSDGELRVLLPYLLSDANSLGRPQVWVSIGSMMSLQQLEDMWDVLPGIDISALVVPNLDTWTARRAQLVLSNTFDELAEAENKEGVNEGADSGPRERAVAAPVWQVQNRLLIRDAGPARVFITTDARRLKGRRDSPAANWDDVSGLLQNFAVDAVDLRGVVRRIVVSAEESGDVGRDVALIRSNFEDSFYVREIVVRSPESEDENAITINFAEMTINAEWASLRAIVQAVEVLGYRESVNLN